MWVCICACVYIYNLLDSAKKLEDGHDVCCVCVCVCISISISISISINI